MSALRVVLESRHFAVSCVPAEAAALIDVFGGKTELKAAERVTNEDWLQRGRQVMNAFSAITCRAVPPSVFASAQYIIPDAHRFSACQQGY